MNAVVAKVVEVALAPASSVKRRDTWPGIVLLVGMLVVTRTSDLAETMMEATPEPTTMTTEEATMTTMATLEAAGAAVELQQTEAVNGAKAMPRHQAGEMRERKILLRRTKERPEIIIKI